MFPEWQPLNLTSFVALLAACFLLYKVSVWRKGNLSHIPYHKFDQDDTPQNYIQNSENLLHSGYLKVREPF